MYLVRKKRNEQCFCVKHAQTGDVHSEHATRKGALAQLRQLSVGGMPKPTPFAPKHALFRSSRPPRPPTPEFVPTPAPTMSQAERDQALDALAPTLSGLLYPAPAPAASSASASSFSMTPSRHVRDVHIGSHITGFIADMQAGRPLPPSLQSNYDTLTKLKVGTPDRRVALAVAFHNLGYGSEAIKNAKRTGQLKPLLTHIASHFRTIIPATLGSGYGGAKGVRGKNLKKGTLFGMPITDSGARIPAPKKRMTLKEFHALEGVPGMHPKYNVFPQGKRAKEAIRGTEDAHEDALFKRDMAKLKKARYVGAPVASALTPIAQAYHALRRNPRDYASLDEFDRVGAVIP